MIQKNYSLLGKNDIVNQNSPAMRQMINIFTEMMANPIVRNNFARILTSIGVKKKSWQTELSTIQVPVLLLWAEDDKTCPVKYAFKLKSLLMNSHLEILKGFRHAAVLEKPDFFYEKIVEFLK